MSRSCTASPLNLPSFPPILSVAAPITIDEIRSNFPANSSAPGPDGVTVMEIKEMDINILHRLINVTILCDRSPESLLESRTVLIPKKENPSEPEDFRLITVSSVISRCLHKILTARLDRDVEIDSRQRAFRRVDGCANNIFLLDLSLRSHRRKLRSIFVAVLDLAKAFDSLSHASIEAILKSQGVPPFVLSYISSVYRNSFTRLSADEWVSDRIYPKRGVKQGDPLSPVIFNIVMDGLLKLLPENFGADVGDCKVNAVLFADDVFLVASSAPGLQHLIDISADYFKSCGLNINTVKSHTLSWKTVPKQKKLVIDARQRFSCGGSNLPSVDRETNWRYLGVYFTPEGCRLADSKSQLSELLAKFTKAPLKPQQRLFGLRTVVIPSLLHELAFGRTSISYLNAMD